MRKLLLFPILTLLTISLQASTHIKFMGIEVNGTYQSFKDSLETKGFVYMSSFETMHKFYGKFANEIVTLEVLATPQSKTICKVIVYFPKKEEWQDL